MTRGHRGSLALRCKAFPSCPYCRFFTAHPWPFARSMNFVPASRSPVSSRAQEEDTGVVLRASRKREGEKRSTVREMGFRFARRIKILPGLWVNLGKKGLSVSTGIRGARATVGARGLRTTVGLPGTGISYTSNHPLHHTAPHGDAPRRPVGAFTWGVSVLLIVLVGLCCLSGIFSARKNLATPTGGTPRAATPGVPVPIPPEHGPYVGRDGHRPGARQ